MDLSHWDFAEEFTGYEAAALILGVEGGSGDDEYRIRVVHERLERDYKRALQRDYWIAIDFPDVGPEPADILPSIGLRQIARLKREASFTEWYNDKHRSRFENQLFERKVIANWLEATGLKSVYGFNPNKPMINEGKTTPTRWPWGDHHTEALGYLEAAARRFWGTNYDPTDPTTAPTNAQVADWLKSERGVSGNMAASIASILRADNLRTGPR